MSTENHDLLVDRRDGVLYLTLNRPDRLNALSDGIISGLIENLGHAANDREVGAIVVTGSGRGFCAGGDINRGQQPGARWPLLQDKAWHKLKAGRPLTAADQVARRSGLR